MTDFRERWDARLESLERAAASMAGTMDRVIPGMTTKKLSRDFQRISVLLSRVDKGDLKRPELLAYASTSVPEYLLANLDNMISWMSQGAVTFAQNGLTILAECVIRLERAVGSKADELQSITQSVGAELVSAVRQSEEMLSTAAKTQTQLEQHEVAFAASLAAIKTAQAQAGTDAANVKEVVARVRAIAGSDGRSKDNLEKIAKGAKDRYIEIEGQLAKARTNLGAVDDLLKQILSKKDDADSVSDDLKKTFKRAEEVLNLSTQAGLAGSYKTESKHLEIKAQSYTILLYIFGIAAALVAAMYVLPNITSLANVNGQKIDFWQESAMVLIRASVLAPLVFLIYFTSKQIKNFDMLRMDYAEKAAASLAYSGYREEMEQDADLLRQLKAGLLVKFSNEPERLLSSHHSRTKASVRTHGFEVETETSSGPITPESNDT